MSYCRSCGAPIRWALTRDGKRMPVDPEPVEDGNLTLQEVKGRLIALPALPLDELGGTDLFRSHFASCPDAAKHRRR